jgi:hypothetical protein
VRGSAGARGYERAGRAGTRWRGDFQAACGQWERAAGDGRGDVARHDARLGTVWSGRLACYVSAATLDDGSVGWVHGAAFVAPPPPGDDERVSLYFARVATRASRTIERTIERGDACAGTRGNGADGGLRPSVRAVHCALARGRFGSSAGTRIKCTDELRREAVPRRQAAAALSPSGPVNQRPRYLSGEVARRQRSRYAEYSASAALAGARIVGRSISAKPAAVLSTLRLTYSLAAVSSRAAARRRAQRTALSLAETGSRRRCTTSAKRELRVSDTLTQDGPGGHSIPQDSPADTRGGRA